MGGGYLRFRPQYLEELSIHQINLANPAKKETHDKLVALVERILDLQRRVDPLGVQDVKREIARTDEEIEGPVYDMTCTD